MTSTAPRRSLRPIEHTARAVIAMIGVATLVLASGCSSGGSDAADPTGDDSAVETDSGSGESTDPAPESDAISDADCQALLEGRAGFVTSANQLTVLDEPEAIDLVFGDENVQQVEAYIALLRPHQDVEPEVFGPLRDGLDNLEADLAAVQEGRLDERVGDYGVVAIVPVLEAIGC